MHAILSAEAALLDALYQGPGYGLELIQRVKRRSRGRLRLGPGNAYPALARLTRRRLVRSWDVRRGAGRPRRYFELSPRGIDSAVAQRRLLEELLQSEPAPRPLSERERTAMAERLDECAELSELALSLREQLLERR
jgi:DNA-binding PadR family transcriptional regulator